VERYGFVGQKSGGEVAMDYLTYNLIRKVKSSQKSSTSTSSKSKTSDNNDSAVSLHKPSGKLIDWAKKNVYSPNPIDRSLSQTILKAQKKTKPSSTPSKSSSHHVKSSSRPSSSKSSSVTKTKIDTGKPSLAFTDVADKLSEPTSTSSKSKTSTSTSTSSTSSTTFESSPIDTGRPPLGPMLPPSSPSNKPAPSSPPSGKGSSGKASPPVGALPNKDELESKLISMSLQGGIAGKMASAALSAGMEKEKEQYGELATEEYKAKMTKASLQSSLSSLTSGFVKNASEANKIKKEIEQTYNNRISNIEENIEFIKKYGTGNWYEYNGQRYKGSDLIKILQSEKEQLEQEKEEKLKELTEYRRKNLLSFWRGSASILGGISSIDKYLKEISSLKEKGAFAIKGEGGELVIFPSKKDYEKWKVIERSGERDVQLYEKEKKGDIWAGLQLFGREVAATFGSFEGFKKPIEWWLHPTWGNEEKEVREYGKTYGKLSWRWSHSGIWGKAGMVLESPGGIVASSLVGGELAGLGVGALSRIAPTAGRIAKVGLTGAGILATGTTAYDIGKTAIVEKDISKALGKGLVYGISFYGAGKLFKGGYEKGFGKAHAWWESKHVPTFETAVFEKTPSKVSGFQEINYRFSLGKNIHETIYFEGIRSGKYNIFATKGKGTIRGWFGRSKVFEIPPKVHIVSEKGVFLSGGRGGISFGASKSGKPHPAVFFNEGYPVRAVIDERFIQYSSWVKGYHLKGGKLQPFSMEGVVYEPRGFTYRGGEKPTFLTPFRGRPSGKTAPIYSTEQLSKLVPPRLPPLEIKPRTRGAVFPVVSGGAAGGKVSVSSIPTSQSEIPSISLASPPSVSFTGVRGGVRVVPVVFGGVKSSHGGHASILRGLGKLSTGLRNMNKSLPSIPSIDTSTTISRVGKINTVKKSAQTSLMKSLQRETLGLIRRGGRVRIPVISNRSAFRLNLKMRKVSMAIPSLKIKTTTALKTEKLSLTTAPVSPPPVISKPKLGVPSGKYTLSLKGKRKKQKVKRRRWKKTLLASPFLVEESYIKYGKATHPKPTKKLWKMGYRTMFKIPTVELMKKGKKNRRKKGGRKR